MKYYRVTLKYTTVSLKEFSIQIAGNKCDQLAIQILEFHNKVLTSYHITWFFGDQMTQEKVENTKIGYIVRRHCKSITGTFHLDVSYY